MRRLVTIVTIVAGRVDSVLVESAHTGTRTDRWKVVEFAVVSIYIQQPLHTRRQAKKRLTSTYVQGDVTLGLADAVNKSL